jgi:hypothetical protein
MTATPSSTDPMPTRPVRTTSSTTTSPGPSQKNCEKANRRRRLPEEFPRIFTRLTILLTAVVFLARSG